MAEQVHSGARLRDDVCRRKSEQTGSAARWSSTHLPSTSPPDFFTADCAWSRHTLSQICNQLQRLHSFLSKSMFNTDPDLRCFVTCLRDSGRSWLMRRQPAQGTVCVCMRYHCTHDELCTQTLCACMLRTFHRALRRAELHRQRLITRGRHTSLDLHMSLLSLAEVCLRR